MKATFQIPDERHREVKTKSALRGQTVRASTLACFGVGRPFVRKNADGPHDMDSIRKSCAKAFRRLPGTEILP